MWDGEYDRKYNTKNKRYNNDMQSELKRDTTITMLKEKQSTDSIYWLAAPLKNRTIQHEINNTKKLEMMNMSFYTIEFHKRECLVLICSCIRYVL